MKKNDSKEIPPVTLPAKKTGRRSMLDAGASFAAIAALGALATACGDDDEGGVDNGSGTGGSGGRSGGSGGKSGGSGGKSGASGGATNTGGSKATGGAAATGGATATGGADGGPAVDADVEGLNNLLTAEYLAITAYSAGAELIGDAEEADPLYALRQVIIDVAVAIQSQHKLHAEALVEAIEGLGGTAVEETRVAARFRPPDDLVASPTISNVLKYAAGAEREAAIAYNQILEGFESSSNRFLASSIEGDETQHFIVLAALVLGLADPGPNLSSETATEVFPASFVYTVGTQGGLDKMPEDYFP